MISFRSRRPTPLARTVAIGALGLGMFASSLGAATPAGAATTSRNILVPKTGALFGAWIQTPNQTQSTVSQYYNDYERLIGRKLGIAHAFYGFTGVFPSYRETMHIAAGRTPLISWGGTKDTAGIVAGKYDAMIRARAAGVKNLGKPVFLRYAWEADGASNPDHPSSPSSYIAAYKHVHDIFFRAGATNAIWVWTMTAYGFKTGASQKYYPGDAYVDWVGADGYNWAPLKAGAPWLAFKDIYGAFYAWGSARNKPMMAPEFGVLEDKAHPDRKAQWFTDMRNQLKYNWPKFKATVYFNSVANSYDNPNAKYPFIIQSSAKATAAFKAAGLDTYFAKPTY